MEDGSGEFRYSLDSARWFLSTFYGIQTVRIDPLPGYDDTNFHVVSEGRDYLLKLTPCDSQYSDCIRTQVDISVYLKASPISSLIAGVVRTTNGEVMAVDDMGWVGRVLEWVDGEVLGDMKSVTDGEWREVGAAIGKLTAAIRTFPVTDSSAISASIISMETAVEAVQSRLSFVHSQQRTELLQFFLAQYGTFATPVLPSLPRQIVHNDLHDFNVIMKAGTVAAIIDFEDVAESYRLIDLATMAGATFQPGDDVLAKVTPVVVGFHSVSPLCDSEVTALLSFMAIRLCIFVTFAAMQRTERPTEPYLYSGDELDWQRLHTLRQVEYSEFVDRLKLALNSAAERL